MPRILPRRYQWTIEHWEHCIRTEHGVRSAGTRPVWREYCATRSTPPRSLQAADGYSIPFPRRTRRSDDYENATEVVAEVWLDVDSDTEIEPSADGGEIDPAEIESYNYSVTINLRSHESMSLLSWPDLVSHPHAGLPATGAGIGVSMTRPSAMGGQHHFFEDLPNGRHVEFFVLAPDADGSW